MKAPLIDRLKLPMESQEQAVRIASRIVAALEMKAEQRIRGYEGAGRWRAYRGSGNDGWPTWREHCRAQSGFTEATMRAYFKSTGAVKGRLGGQTGKRLLALMEVRPALLSTADRQDLIKGLAAAIGDSTQAELVRESAAGRPVKKGDGKDAARVAALRSALLKARREMDTTLKGIDRVLAALGN